ncbi:MAG: 6-phosphogluconolactonase [Solirubrobacteraceae bacterium]|nr:6-phosphogluconolactonase [Solirubrobacteraceae bacterium]
MSVDLEVLEDPARAAAALMVAAAIGGGHIVLAGGSTPKAAYTSFVDTVEAVGLDLSRTTFWLGDERCVEPDDERSNYHMIKESLLDPLARLSDLSPVRRMKGELGPEEGADDYERELRGAGPPRFDLVLLGIGSDGHTASLFPDQESLSVTERLVVGVPEAGLEPFVPRITLTFPALSASRQIALLASGGSKAEAVAKAFAAGARPDPHVPSSMLAPHAERLTVLLDAEAAQGLTR